MRVFAPLGATGLTVCDYMFQDEEAANSAERFQELLDLKVEENSIEMALERVPGVWGHADICKYTV